MDYNFNEEQELLKKTANSFLANECDSLFVREMEKDPKGITPEIWKKMAELGWMGVVFPEEYGGIGGNFLDLMILLYEMGYAITTVAKLIDIYERAGKSNRLLFMVIETLYKNQREELVARSKHTIIRH